MSVLIYNNQSYNILHLVEYVLIYKWSCVLLFNTQYYQDSIVFIELYYYYNISLRNNYFIETLGNIPSSNHFQPS